MTQARCGPYAHLGHSLESQNFYIDTFWKAAMLEFNSDKALFCLVIETYFSMLLYEDPCKVSMSELSISSLVSATGHGRAVQNVTRPGHQPSQS